jgi:hypothetical protein
LSSASRPHSLLDEAEDEAGATRDHQDDSHGIDAHMRDVEVQREVKDRPNGDQEYGRSGVIGSFLGSALEQIAKVSLLLTGFSLRLARLACGLAGGIPPERCRCLASAPPGLVQRPATLVSRPASHHGSLL